MVSLIIQSIVWELKRREITAGNTEERQQRGLLTTSLVKEERYVRYYIQFDSHAN